MNERVLSGGQIRAARGFLRWSAETLSEKSKVGLSTVKRAEGVDGTPPITRPNADAIRRALEAAGIEFIAENGGGPGVRMRGQLPPYDVDDVTKLLAVWQSSSGKNSDALAVLMKIMYEPGHGGLPSDLVKEIDAALPFKPEAGWPEPGK